MDGNVNTLLWPIIVYSGAVLLLAASLLVISYFLGQRHEERATGLPYESGIFATGSARVRFDIKFYLPAIFFVIFDLEAVFIFAWAVAIRQTGWAGYMEVLVFVLVLLAALAYIWKIGALDWRTKPARKEA